ncbi:RAN binding protein 1 [Actinidia rufa]|uniref:RAN binding protein 1 n=1 Tax=Actinidia rufa TaxID=165716 RepID=A0A7J0FSA2_9ERIC|nr:RAN binding protein 1 [Actinidia rufa]
MASTDPEHRDVEETAAGEDEDTGAQVAPIVKLEEVAVTTGEEDEDTVLDLKSKLYRFDKDGNQWKERGAGTVKLLKHKETGKVRLVMRQSKTLKICANHLVLPTMSVQEHAGNDKSCVWHATDFADGELKDELFCIRFGSVEITTHGITADRSPSPSSWPVTVAASLRFLHVRFRILAAWVFKLQIWVFKLLSQSIEHLWMSWDIFQSFAMQISMLPYGGAHVFLSLSMTASRDCKIFMEMFQEVAESQQKKEKNEDASASAAAGLLEKLNVEDKKTEDKDNEQVPVAAAKEKESEIEPGKVDAEKKGEEPAPST